MRWLPESATHRLPDVSFDTLPGTRNALSALPNEPIVWAHCRMREGQLLGLHLLDTYSHVLPSINAGTDEMLEPLLSSTRAEHEIGCTMGALAG